MIIAGILAFAAVMSAITTTTLYTLDNMLSFHTYLRTHNGRHTHTR